jgi:uncharacterized protein YjbI with pentapeptide repeats
VLAAAKGCLAWGRMAQIFSLRLEKHRVDNFPCGGPRRDLARWNFCRAQLGGEDFAGAQLQDAVFAQANLQGANLQGADARGADFRQADLTGADLTGALLQGARLQRAILRRACCRQALLLSAHLEYASVSEADFTAANLEWAWVQGVDFRQAILTCALLLNVRGFSDATRRLVEIRGGFTGTRAMILGRELYESPLDRQGEEEGAH